MDYLIIAATSFEIAPFSAALAATGKNAGLLVTGVGLTASTYTLTRYLASHRPGIIIQAGIGGCFNPEIPLGTVLVAGRDCIADQGVLENGAWKSTLDMGFTPANEAPYRNGWLANPGFHPDPTVMDGKGNRPLTAGLNPGGLPVVDAITVNQVSTDPAQIGLFREKYNPVLESMEGAALHYAAIMEQIPFLQIRAVSNYVGERDKSRWAIKNAIESLNKELLYLLSQS